MSESELPEQEQHEITIWGVITNLIGLLSAIAALCLLTFKEYFLSSHTSQSTASRPVFHILLLFIRDPFLSSI